MKDLDAPSDLRAAAESYCRALHDADAGALEELCHPRFLMSWTGPDGAVHTLDRAQFAARVGSRQPFDGAPEFEILETTTDGDMAHVRLTVSVPPRRFRDHLGFLRGGGRWRLVNKLFVVADGPAMEV